MASSKLRSSSSRSISRDLSRLPCDSSCALAAIGALAPAIGTTVGAGAVCLTDVLFAHASSFSVL